MVFEVDLANGPAGRRKPATLARRWSHSLGLVLSLVAVACTPAAPAEPSGAPSEPGVDAARPSARRLTVLGTNDLHGRLRALPLLASYVDAVRSDGPVLLVDAGDMFQGTIESNENEGAVVVQAYNAMGYDAVALGNHEFDYGPVGQARDGADVFGALRERIAQARFPVLSANLVEKRTGTRPQWDGLSGSAVIDVRGISVGVIGGLTEETPSVVLPELFAGLDVTALAPTLVRESSQLRAQGARVVVAALHAGGKCTQFDTPRDLSSCERGAEVIELAQRLPTGTVDVIVAGHTHQAMAHVVNGIAVVEAYANGRAVSRVDMMLPAESQERPGLVVFPPRELCDATASACETVRYEDRTLRRSAAIERIVQPALQRAQRVRERPIGVELTAEFSAAFAEESALGNLFADLLRAAGQSDVGLVNGGSLRAPLPAGALSFGALYEAMPFDNVVARVRLSAEQLSAVIARHLASGEGGLISVSGVRVEARCSAGSIDVRLLKNGRAVAPNSMLWVATSNYLATGGDGLLSDVLGASQVEIRSDLGVREALASELAKYQRLAPETYLTKGRPRMKTPSTRPVKCAGPSGP